MATPCALLSGGKKLRKQVKLFKTFQLPIAISSIAVKKSNTVTKKSFSSLLLILTTISVLRAKHFMKRSTSCRHS